MTIPRQWLPVWSALCTFAFIIHGSCSPTEKQCRDGVGSAECSSSPNERKQMLRDAAPAREQSWHPQDAVSFRDTPPAQDTGKPTIRDTPPTRDTPPPQDTPPQDTPTIRDAPTIRDTPPTQDARVNADKAPPAPSSGCNQQGRTGTFYESVNVKGTKRTYYVSVPPSYDSKRRYPLVFGYHGGSDFGGKKMRTYLKLETVKPLASEIFVYPDSLGVNQAGGPGFQYGAGVKGQTEDAFFDAILKAMKQKYCIDANRVFVTGQSAGGGYAVQLACHRGNVIRAAVPVAANLVRCNSTSCRGWDTDPSNCVGKAHVMQMHSPDDWIKLIPFGYGTLEFMASAAGCGAFVNGSVKVSQLNKAPSVKHPNYPCVRRQGCDRQILFCSYKGGHQIPSWYKQAGFKYEEVTMKFFRSF